MTYGYGFWRSGYTTLIPWHWSWVMEPEPLDYLRSRYSGCGQRLDSQGRVVPAIYWECFREGYDDSRYLYSLQQAAWERDGSTEPYCQTVVDSAKGLLQEIWDSIEVQDRYLSTNLWPSIEFDARRWQMAVLIEQLQQFPQLRQGNAQSVYVQKLPPSVQASPQNEAFDSDNVEIRELANEPKKWVAESSESKLGDTTEANQPIGPLRWTVFIDHNSAGTADGEHLMGWPRIRREFARGELDFTKYDYLEVYLTFDSSRDEAQDNFTPLGLCFSSFASEKHYEFEHDLGDSKRQSVRLVFSVSELIDAGGKGVLPWKSINYLQLYVSEANYPDEHNLTFEIHTIRLLRFKEPQIVSVDLPRVFFLPTRYLPVQCDLVGVKLDDANIPRLTAKVVDKSGEVVAKSHVQIAKSCTIVLDTANLKAGDYQLELASENGHGSGARIVKTFQCVDGPEIVK